jgi:hypothetical protein
LGVGETFTGKAVEMVRWASVSVFVFSDAGSVVNGLSLQQSSDAVNWDVKTEFTISAQGSGTFGVDLESQYFRVVYANGGVAQSEFRLQSVFHETRQASLFAKNPGQFIPVRITNGSEYDDGTVVRDLLTRTMLAQEEQTRQQKITNLYLAELVGERFDETDIEDEE